jgi:hypothetical protein
MTDDARRLRHYIESRPGQRSTSVGWSYEKIAKPIAATSTVTSTNAMSRAIAAASGDFALTTTNRAAPIQSAATSEIRRDQSGEPLTSSAATTATPAKPATHAKNRADLTEELVAPELKIPPLPGSPRCSSSPQPPFQLPGPP